MNPTEVDRINLYLDVFSSEKGEQVLMDLLRICGVMNGMLSHPMSVEDANYHNGRRSVALEILATLALGPYRVKGLMVRASSNTLEFF